MCRLAREVVGHDLFPPFPAMEETCLAPVIKVLIDNAGNLSGFDPRHSAHSADSMTPHWVLFFWPQISPFLRIIRI